MREQPDLPRVAFSLLMNRRWAARVWSAPVLWRFAIGSRGLTESARGLAHSKTLAHKRRFKVSKREISVGGILAPPLSRWVRKAGVRENVLDQARRSRQPDGSLQRRHSFHVSGCPVRPANCSAPRRQPAEPAVSSHAS